MKAAVLNEFGQPLTIVEREMPVPGAGEVLLKIRAIGICGTDLKLWHGKKAGTRLPLVMGHEIAGEVVELGPGVADIQIGTRGVVSIYLSCFKCSYCMNNRETVCQELKGRIGFTCDGGLQEYLVIPACNFIAVEGIPLQEACVVTDAIATVYSGLNKVGIKSGDRVLVVGLGGLGIHAAQLAEALGATVTGIDVTEDKLAYARSFGIKRTILAADSCAETVAALQKLSPEPFDIVVETVSRTETIAIDLEVLGPGGKLLIFGYGAKEIAFPPYALIPKELSIFGTRASSRRDVRQALELVRKGLIKPSISRFYSQLEDVNTALAALEKGEVLGRQVIVFD